MFHAALVTRRLGHDIPGLEDLIRKFLYGDAQAPPRWFVAVLSRHFCAALEGSGCQMRHTVRTVDVHEGGADITVELDHSPGCGSVYAMFARRLATSSAGCIELQNIHTGQLGRVLQCRGTVGHIAISGRWLVAACLLSEPQAPREAGGRLADVMEEVLRQVDRADNVEVLAWDLAVPEPQPVELAQLVLHTAYEPAVVGVDEDRAYYSTGRGGGLQARKPESGALLWNFKLLQCSFWEPSPLRRAPEDNVRSLAVAGRVLVLEVGNSWSEWCEIVLLDARTGLVQHRTEDFWSGHVLRAGLLHRRISMHQAAVPGSQELRLWRHLLPQRHLAAAQLRVQADFSCIMMDSPLTTLDREGQAIQILSWETGVLQTRHIRHPASQRILCLATSPARPLRLRWASLQRMLQLLMKFVCGGC